MTPSLPRYARASGLLLLHLSSISGDQDDSVVSRRASSPQSITARFTPLNGSHSLRIISTFSCDIARPVSLLFLRASDVVHRAAGVPALALDDVGHRGLGEDVAGGRGGVAEDSLGIGADR